MNTLPTKIKAQLFGDKSEYLTLRTHWSVLMNSERKHQLAAAHHLFYLVLMGRDWRKGFTPVSNARKLDNGAFAGWALFQAMMRLHSRFHAAWLLEPFDGLVTLEMLQQIRDLVPSASPFQYQPQDFANGNYPFAAYTIIDEVASMM